jgi:hypothetical protein
MSAAEVAELRAKTAKAATAAQLEAELAALKQQQQREREREGDDAACVVCLTNVKNHVAVPCGHMAMCGACCEKLGKNKPCPICRVEVQIFVKVFT